MQDVECHLVAIGWAYIPLAPPIQPVPKTPASQRWRRSFVSSFISLVWLNYAIVIILTDFKEEMISNIERCISVTNCARSQTQMLLDCLTCDRYPRRRVVLWMPQIYIHRHMLQIMMPHRPFTHYATCIHTYISCINCLVTHFWTPLNTSQISMMTCCGVAFIHWHIDEKHLHVTDGDKVWHIVTHMHVHMRRYTYA